jgi:hypothetical protein
MLNSFRQWIRPLCEAAANAWLLAAILAHAACKTESKSETEIRVYSDLTSIQVMINIYHESHHEWPTKPDELQEILNGMRLQDPWGSSYRTCWMPPDRYLLQSAGLDKEFDTDDDLVAIFRQGKTIAPLFLPEETQ